MNTKSDAAVAAELIERLHVVKRTPFVEPVVGGQYLDARDADEVTVIAIYPGAVCDSLTVRSSLDKRDYPVSKESFFNWFRPL